MVLLRKVIGDALRAKRLAQHRTLREVSTGANVSLGYLSEIERGHKEASSELLASICEALGTPLSEMLGEVSATFALAEQMEEAFAASAADLAETVSADARVPAEAPVPAAANALVPAGARAGDEPELEVTDGDLTVQVRSDGPLRTTLTARRTPGQRHVDPVLVR